MRLGAWATGVVAAFYSLSAAALPHQWQLNMRTGVTQSAANAHSIHMIMFTICCVIGVIVFGAMAVAMVRFRRSKGAVAATWSHNTLAEIIWTVIPILILIVMAVPATSHLTALYDARDSEMSVKVTGYQWMWRYDYIGEDVGFVARLERESDRTRQLDSGLDPFAVKDGDQSTYLLDTDRRLVLPTDTKIRFLITGDDVIHAWWVPSLGWKQDAIPGIVNEAWTEIREPGIYRGQCAELCGKDHAFMPIVVEAVSPDEYRAWLEEQKAARTAEQSGAGARPVAAAGG
ncbi:cytochrome c oxidase subunit II [Coralloluteibacterium stylophorae]|uniref:Cytochrome c oxidase subunit 2 n=1 Tax=Coralloluteibacterium stylophorae TaxID=1776034 RepID=A0AAP2CDS9_9GAMM|nr:cytochrome c oxidase subunit II [Coralloluteibacterium stylophorae]MBS7458065.1 cytochrome c oxidase subunit II [Coralloluteibacterium stylophorae]